MTIDPTTVPIGAVVQCDPTGVRTHLRNTECPEMGITRVFVPVPDGMTHDEAVAALADAGAWVEVEYFHDIPEGARCRSEWSRFAGKPSRSYVHRDDLPPTDPDAELVEDMARAGHAAVEAPIAWEDRSEPFRDEYRTIARAALAALREHEAKS